MFGIVLRRMLFLVALLLILGDGAGSCGQVKESEAKPGTPDLSGTWHFDRSRSRLSDLLQEMTRGAKSYDLMIVIEQNGSAFTITESNEIDTSNLKEPFPASPTKVETYFADGRGEHDAIDTRKSTSQVVAKIVDNKLIILMFGLDTYNRKILMGTIEYSLADNGTTLIRESKLELVDKTASRVGQKSPLDSVMVYTRAKK